MHAHGSSQELSYRSFPPPLAHRSLAQHVPNTPIYDTLYAEWVDAFRSTPGDRNGEEGLLVPVAFGRHPYQAGFDAGYGAVPRANAHSSHNQRGYETPNSTSRQGHWQRVASLGQHPGAVPSAAELSWGGQVEVRVAQPRGVREPSAAERAQVTSLVPPTWPPPARPRMPSPTMSMLTEPDASRV